MAKQRRDSQIQFHFLVPPFYFPKRTSLKNFLYQLFKAEGKKVAHINYVFCDDEYLLSLNNEYLHHNTLTDIITFELSAPDEPLIADIYISVKRVRENASIYKASFKSELHRVIFHGALHLCGYKDKSQRDAALMRKLESKYLGLYGFTWNDVTVKY